MCEPSASRGLALLAEDPDLFETFYRRHVVAITRFVARRTIRTWSPI
jgi:hypothetical protein